MGKRALIKVALSFDIISMLVCDPSCSMRCASCGVKRWMGCLVVFFPMLKYCWLIMLAMVGGAMPETDCDVKLVFWSCTDLVVVLDVGCVMFDASCEKCCSTGGVINLSQTMFDAR